jgi:hypothetical protein
MYFDKKEFPNQSSPQFLAMLDLWRARHEGRPSRVEAIEELIRGGLSPEAREWVAK